MLKITEKFRCAEQDLREASSVKLAFFGDSVTQGCFEIREGSTDFITVTDGEAVYHNRLRRILQSLYPHCPVNVLNAGISGDDTDRAVLRLQRDVLDYRPDLTVVCFGLNDVGKGAGNRENYLTNLRQIFSLLSPCTETVFMTPNRMCSEVDESQIDGKKCLETAYACCELQNNGVFDSYMDGVRQLCREMHIPLCDCYADWQRLAESGVRTTELLSNRINHPTREMHALFAARLTETLFL